MEVTNGGGFVLRGPAVDPVIQTPNANWTRPFKLGLQLEPFRENTGPSMVANGVPVVEVITDETIITKSMVDGDNMIRLEGF